MKKLIPITIITLALFLNSCGLKEIVDPGGSITGDYQPVTAGSTWKYKIEVPGTATDEMNVTANSETKNYNGKTYFKSTRVFKSTDSTVYDYYAHAGNAYFTRSVEPAAGFDDPNLLEFQYLDDSKPVGSNWIVKSDPSSLFQATSQTTLVEKNISKTVNGKAFKGVIHTNTSVLLDLGTGSPFEFTAFDYYIAKGVGIVEIDISLAGQTVGKQTLVSYNIK